MMATEERLPPACAFALSVLAERDQDPEAVPEEAVEAAQQHITTCPRCIATSSDSSTIRSASPRKKKKVRRAPESSLTSGYSSSNGATIAEENPPLSIAAHPQQWEHAREVQQAAALVPLHTQTPLYQAQETELEPPYGDLQQTGITAGGISCEECRKLLPEYVETLDSGQNVATLYPDVQEHLVSCESGCLVLLDMVRQEAKATRKYRRKVVKNPFAVIWWELTGFFRGGQIPMHPMALAYGTLILLLAIGSLGAYLGISIHEKIYHPPAHSRNLPTPDGIGLSDGLKIYDACNANSYRLKQQAAQLMQKKALDKAGKLLAEATSAPLSDTSGCNGSEAAIYSENLRVRQSGHPYSIVIVAFDSGPGRASPEGGTDRHILAAAYTQELVGAFIAQQNYNTAQIKQAGAPLLYLVLANSAGIEQGALQLANTIAELTEVTSNGTAENSQSTKRLQDFGLLATGMHPLLGVLGLGPSSLVQVVLPVLCRAGVPLIAPTATGLFIIDQLSQTSMYRHCTPGFAFVRFSPDESSQSRLAADYAHDQLHATNAAIIYDPSNPSSKGAAQGFSERFTQLKNTRIVAKEAAVASGLLDANGRPQASQADLLAVLNDALNTQPRPDLLFAPLLTNDVTVLTQALAKLPSDKQPTVLLGGEFIQPAALQGLVQWSRQQQLTLPHIYVAQSSAARPPSDNQWQKQFYSSFCTSFATPGSFCSGATALDQGALFFADGIKIFTDALGSDGKAQQDRAQLVKRISATQFIGVSCPIALQLRWDNVITSTKVVPVILSIQQDGNIQIVG